MRILNLYAGIGGNRGQWGDEHDITSVELDPHIAAAYRQLWPNDTLIEGDAHQYLLEHYDEFDFIWSSPPCPTHTRMQLLRVLGYNERPKFPDGLLFEEVAFLSYWAKAPYVVENVIPYYGPILAGGKKIDRHIYWANFDIPELGPSKQENLRAIQIPELQKMHGVNLDGIRLPNKRQVLRNMVPPRVGRHILDAGLLAMAEPA